MLTITFGLCMEHPGKEDLGPIHTSQRHCTTVKGDVMLTYL